MMQISWFHEHPPLQETTELISPSSGVVADERTNCHLSMEIFLKGILRIVGDVFRAVKLNQSGQM